MHRKSKIEDYDEDEGDMDDAISLNRRVGRGGVSKSQNQTMTGRLQSGMKRSMMGDSEYKFDGGNDNE